MNEIEIIKKISKNPEAFAEIIDMYEKKLLRYILKITNISIEDAENLLQDIFLKVYIHINDYDAKFSFSSWVYRIAHNIVIDYHRKNKNICKIESEWDDELQKLIENIVDEWNNPEDILNKKELANCIQKSLCSLNINFKEALILKFIEEKNYTEISDILRIPEWTVWTLINRWKKLLKEIILKNKCI